jgi:hypothetical protein
LAGRVGGVGASARRWSEGRPRRGRSFRQAGSRTTRDRRDGRPRRARESQGAGGRPGARSAVVAAPAASATPARPRRRQDRAPRFPGSRGGSLVPAPIGAGNQEPVPGGSGNQWEPVGTSRATAHGSGVAGTGSERNLAKEGRRAGASRMARQRRDDRVRRVGGGPGGPDRSVDGGASATFVNALPRGAFSLPRRTLTRRCPHASQGLPRVRAASSRSEAAIGCRAVAGQSNSERLDTAAPKRPARVRGVSP